MEQSGLAYTILRPVFFMQNLLTMVRDGAIATAARDGRLAMVDTRDIASVAASALTSCDHEGQTYTLTGPEAHSFDDIAGILSSTPAHRSGTCTSDPTRSPQHCAPRVNRLGSQTTWHSYTPC